MEDSKRRKRIFHALKLQVHNSKINLWQSIFLTQFESFDSHGSKFISSETGMPRSWRREQVGRQAVLSSLRDDEKVQEEQLVWPGALHSFQPQRRSWCTWGRTCSATSMPPFPASPVIKTYAKTYAVVLPHPGCPFQHRRLWTRTRRTACLTSSIQSFPASEIIRYIDHWDTPLEPAPRVLMALRVMTAHIWLRYVL